MAALVLPRSGELNRRVQIRLQPDTANAGFGHTASYSTGIASWAKKEPVRSLELRAGVNTGELPTDLFWFRWGTGTKPEDFTTSHVLEHNGTRYRVLDSIDVGDLRQFTGVSAKYLGAV